MQRIVRGGLALLVLAAGMVAMAGTAQACSCVVETPKQQIARADAVFIGQIIDRSGKHHTSDAQVISADAFTYTVQVDRVFKGEVSEVQQVVAGSDEASCGIVFPKDGPLLVYGLSARHSPADSDAPVRYSTNLCSGSGSTSVAPASLGVGAPPPTVAGVDGVGGAPSPDLAAPEPLVPTWVWAGLVVLAALVAVAGAIALRRRRG